MEEIVLMSLAMIMAMATVLLIHPRLVRIAKMKEIVDNPNVRRLNKVPVPVLGGVGVFMGLTVSLFLFSNYVPMDRMFIPMGVMLLMLYVGVADDILDIRAWSKMLFQIFGVCVLIFIWGYKFDSLYGIMGIYDMPDYVSYPLTLFCCVGIINAINLIDGVDGLASGYGMFVSAVLGYCFYWLGDLTYAIVAFATMGALLPFFLFNVFSHKNKMFIGDGGSLVLGMLFAVLIIAFFNTEGVEEVFVCPIGFMLALFAIPVFDTIRVMLTRMLHHKSPFSPDKTHLHHIILQIGYSHAGTMRKILLLNLLVLLVAFLSRNMLQQWQILLIVIAGCLVTYGPWFLITRLQKKCPNTFQRIVQNVGKARAKRRKIYRVLAKLTDYC